MRSIIVFWAALSLAGAACSGSLTPSPDAGDAAVDVCTRPFDPGPCHALVPVYAFVDGACVMRTYGGCEGNGNRFERLEQCMATCEGPPDPGACPPNRIAREICLACGPTGGCTQRATVCALVCDADSGLFVCGDESSLPVCYDGVCQTVCR